MLGVGKEQPKKFRDQFTLEQRRAESRKITAKYPDRLPVIVERAEKSDVPDLDKKKFLVPDMTVAQFMYTIRQRIKLTPDKAMFFFVNNTLPVGSATMQQLYKQHKEEDDFLYIVYSGESTFG